MDNVEKINLNTTEVLKNATYNNGELAFIGNLKDINIPRAFQTEFSIVALILEGEASVTINGIPYKANKNNIFIGTPNNIIENGVSSDDFKCQCIGMSQEYIQKKLPITENLWDIKILFEKNPVCTLHPNEVTVWRQYYDLLCSKIHLPSAAQEKIIDTLIQAFFYELQYILGRVIQITPRPYTSGEFLLKKFIDLLETSYPKNREVSYYAEKLHVTPKYLSSICKASCGQTASRLIDKYVLKDIEYLMKQFSKTIKEIANELDFPSISFFGKYVKKHFGMSPRALREEYRKECSQCQYQTQSSQTIL